MLPYKMNRLAARVANGLAVDAWLESVFDGNFDLGTRTAADIRYQAVFMMGGPGAGKSHVKAISYLKHTGFHNIDSDEMKKRHPDYDPDRPFLVHEWSLQEQHREFERVLKTGEPFVQDGTGWNPAYMLDDISQARKAGYRIFLVYAYVPVEVSLFRNRQRGRFVPEQVVIDKCKAVERSFGQVKRWVDKYKVVLNYTPAQLEEAKRDLAVYPAPQPVRPPRPGSPGYGAPAAEPAARRVAAIVPLKGMRLPFGAAQDLPSGTAIKFLDYELSGTYTRVPEGWRENKGRQRADLDRVPPVEVVEVVQIDGSTELTVGR